jgi:hypothetical protein
MVDFVGTIVTAALMTVVVNALITFMDIGRGAKLVLAGVAGLWMGLAAAAAASGWLAISRPFPVIGIFVAMPLIAVAIASAWPAGRAALLALPTKLLIGLNIGRVFAVLFLLLAAQGRLAGPFPHFAGWGDIITGVVAVPLLFVAVERNATAIAAWNYFGAADLVLAIFLGVTSAEGSPLQLFFTSPGSQAMQYLPWSFVPTVLVPFYLIMHATVWVQLRRMKAERWERRSFAAAPPAIT